MSAILPGSPFYYKFSLFFYMKFEFDKVYGFTKTIYCFITLEKLLEALLKFYPRQSPLLKWQQRVRKAIPSRAGQSAVATAVAIRPSAIESVIPLLNTETYRCFKPNIGNQSKGDKYSKVTNVTLPLVRLL